MSKKLVGGEFLLDLTPLTIEESVDVETYTNITNASVIEQLTNLKTFINNPKAIKPIWVKFVNDENNAVIVTRGSLSIVDTGEFDIDVAIKGYTLKIHIEFTQAELEDHTPIDDWYIDTNDAKYLFTSDTQNFSPIAESVANDIIEEAELGTIADVLGLDSNGGLVKETRDSAVKPIYWHGINMYKTHGSGGGTSAILLHILKNNSALINTIDKFKAWCESISGQVIVSCNGTIKYNNVFYPLFIRRDKIAVLYFARKQLCFVYQVELHLMLY